MPLPLFYTADLTVDGDTYAHILTVILLTVDFLLTLRHFFYI